MRAYPGFTLIELLIVLALLLVVSAAAYPAYTELAVRARRTEAQAALQMLMQQQERYYSRHGTYIAFSASATDADARDFRWWSGNKAEGSAYEIEGKACEGEDIRDCIQIVATPGSPRVDRNFRDNVCKSLTLTSTGMRLADGPVLKCWR